VLLEDGKDVLKKVELFVARTRPAIVAVNDQLLFFFVAGFVDDSDAALFTEWRIGHLCRFCRSWCWWVSNRKSANVFAALTANFAWCFLGR